MKTTSLGLLFMLLSLTFMTGCKDLLDVTEDFTFEHSFFVDGSNLSFSRSELIDLMEKSDVIDEYGEKIKQVEITKVECWLTSHPGSSTQSLVSGSLKVADASGTGFSTVTTMQNQILSLLYMNSTEVPLQSEGVNKMNYLIKNQPHQLTISLDGTLNEGPLGFTMVFKFTGTITANPLD
jgi:hypothetical protein